jgi:hypothetical protein
VGKVSLVGCWNEPLQQRHGAWTSIRPSGVHARRSCRAGDPCDLLSLLQAHTGFTATARRAPKACLSARVGGSLAASGRVRESSGCSPNPEPGRFAAPSALGSAWGQYHRATPAASSAADDEVGGLGVVAVGSTVSRSWHTCLDAHAPEPTALAHYDNCSLSHQAASARPSCQRQPNFDQVTAGEC